MNKTISQAHEYMGQLRQNIQDLQADYFHLGLAVPFTILQTCASLAEGVLIGAQNMNEASFGALTGEINSDMIEDAGAQFVIIGHSERRHIFAENELVISHKVARALRDSSLSVILCVGETLTEREQGRTLEVVGHQLCSAFATLSFVDWSRVKIAYEPVWAVGTGHSATVQQIAFAHHFLRQCLCKLSVEKGSKVPILYGGSVQVASSYDIIRACEVGGLLVGGASLQVDTFLEIAKVCFTSHG